MLKSIGQWIFRNLVGIDQQLNVLFYPLLNLIPGIEYEFGHPDDTLSEVFARNRPNCSFCRWMCRILDAVDKNHCDRSID